MKAILSCKKIPINRLLSITLKVGLFAWLVVSCASCSNLTGYSKTPLHQADNYYNFLQPTFSDYLTVTESWLRTNRRFISDLPETELVMNMPFETGDKQGAEKAILLVHGLGDSPFSFSDIAISLEKHGFYVQTLLLPGHGSKPQEMTLPRYVDWQRIVDHYASLLKDEFKSVWLGGYSTGGNLVTIHAINSNNPSNSNRHNDSRTKNKVDGLMLFSPGFQSNVPFIEKFAPAVSLFVDGYEREETIMAKYSSSSINGAMAYSDSASVLRGLLEDNTVTIPTLIVQSEFDSAVDSLFVKDAYLKHFHNPKNKLVWYGEAEETDNSIQILSMKLDEHRISTGSHMSSMFSPENAYYGKKGEFRGCKIKLIAPVPSRCKPKPEPIWYAAWGYQEEGKVHGRLTWNPYYKELEQAMLSVSKGL